MSTYRHVFCLLGLLVWAAAPLGCVATPTHDAEDAGYRTINAEPRRDTDGARRANEAGLGHMEAGDLEKAASAFERALAADVKFGPAHNNLGKVYFQQGRFYQAAWEFEYACKLLPRNPEPRNNLGLVLEQAGELDAAVEQYRQAVALSEGGVIYKANLARALVGRGDDTDEVRRLLQDVLEHDHRPDWLIWARRQLAQMGG